MIQDFNRLWTFYGLRDALRRLQTFCSENWIFLFRSALDIRVQSPHQLPEPLSTELSGAQIRSDSPPHSYPSLSVRLLAYMNRRVKLSSQWPVATGKRNSCFLSLLKSTPLSTAFFSGAVGRQVHLKWDLLWQNNCWVIVEMSFGKGFEFTPPAHIMALLGMSNTSTSILVWKLQAGMYSQLDRDIQTYARIIALRFHSHVWYFIAWPTSAQISFFHLVAPVVNS